MARFCLLLPLLICLAAAAPELPRVPEERRADVYAVYSAALSNPSLGHADTNQKYLIFAATGVAGEGSPERCLRPPAAHAAKVRELARDARRLREEAYQLEPALKPPKGYELITAQESASFMDPRRHPPSPELARRLSGATDLITLGNVYFDSGRTIAAVAILNQCGPACGRTAWRAFEKVNGQWVEREWIECVQYAAAESSSGFATP